MNHTERTCSAFIRIADALDAVALIAMVVVGLWIIGGLWL